MAEQGALAKYDPRKHMVIARAEDLVPLSDFVTIDVVAVPLGECADVGGGKMMPARDATDRIATAAGIVFIEDKCRVEKLDRNTWVGRAAARRMMRDGSWSEAVAEYEWDAELRADLALRRRPGDRDAKIDDMRQFGRQRADTGARMRVIRLLAGIPTSFKRADVQRPLVVHRCSLDARAMAADPTVRAIMVERMLGATQDVFGPPTMRDVTPAPAELPESQEEVAEVTEQVHAKAPQGPPQDVAATVSYSDPQGFVGAEAEPGGSFTEEEQAGIEGAFDDGDDDLEVERHWLKKELGKGDLPSNAADAIADALADEGLTVEDATKLRRRIVATRKKQEGKS